MRSTKHSVMVVASIMIALLGAMVLGGASPVAAQSDDGRLNCDAAAPIVLYCAGDYLEVYWVAGGSSELVLKVAYADIEAIGVPDAATWVAGTENGSVDVYVLDTGEIQVNAYSGDEMWVARWVGCSSAPAEVEVYSTLTGEQLSAAKDTCTMPEPEVEPEMECETAPEPERDLTQMCLIGDILVPCAIL